jgi:hypothetical protein
MDSFLPRSVRSIAMDFEQLKWGQLYLSFIVGNQRYKIQPLIQQSAVETKQNTNQGIAEFPTQDAAPRQSVVGKKNRSSVATKPRTGKSTYMPKQIYHTEGTYSEMELSFKITTRTFGVRHEQFQRGEQPYSSSGYGRCFSHKCVLKVPVLYTLDIVRNLVICVMCSGLGIRKSSALTEWRVSFFRAFLISVIPLELFVSFTGWFVNRWRAGGGRNPVPVTPCSLHF